MRSAPAGARFSTPPAKPPTNRDGMPNVRSITNEIQVAGASSMGSRASDTTITAQIKGRFINVQGLNPVHVKVITEAGTHPNVVGLVYVSALAPDAGDWRLYAAQQVLDAGGEDGAERQHVTDGLDHGAGGRRQHEQADAQDRQDPPPPLVDISAATYTPPQAMRDLVLTRDKTCQAPGCRTPAQACDLDHTVEHPCGPTCPANLCALCRTHHRVKTLTDTTCRAVTGDPDHPGGHRWTLPSGHTYTSRREPALDHPALVQATAGRSADGPPARGDPCADSDPPDDYDDLPPF